MKVKRIEMLYFLPALMLMIMIFYLSNQPAEVSSSLSGGILRTISEQLSSQTTKIEPETYHTLFRKLAHFSVYFMLSCSLLFAFVKSKLNINYLWVILICLLYAMSDEFHQLFITGRSGEIRDVIIDTSGATLALILFLMTKKIREKRK